MSVERIVSLLLYCSVAVAVLFAAVSYGENDRGGAAANLLIAGLLYAAGRVAAR